MSTTARVAPPAARRPLKSRGSARIRGFAAALAARGVSPNAISLAGIGFAAAGAAALLALRDVPLAALAAVAGIQLRLLCNLLDGLVAVEGGLGGRDGELFNEVPDRLSDTLLLVAAGVAGGTPELGWAAALMAALTAYVRLLGGALGKPQDFSGLMSKPRRMALLSAAALVGALAPRALAVACAIVVTGSLVTCAGRLARIRRAL